MGKLKLTDEEITVVKQIVAERVRGNLPRIDFNRSDTVVRSVRISKRMANDAMAKSGVNFNRLVESLIWEYLERDPKYTKGADNGKA